MREVGKMTPKGIELDPEVATGMVAHRAALLTLANRISGEAQALLARCNKAWPPKPWHRNLNEIREESAQPAGDPLPMCRLLRRRATHRSNSP